MRRADLSISLADYMNTHIPYATLMNTHSPYATLHYPSSKGFACAAELTSGPRGQAVARPDLGIISGTVGERS